MKAPSALPLAVILDALELALLEVHDAHQLVPEPEPVPSMHCIFPSCVRIRDALIAAKQLY